MPSDFELFRGHDNKAEHQSCGDPFFFPFRSSLDSKASECEKMFSTYLKMRDSAKTMKGSDEEKVVIAIFDIMKMYLAQV